MQEFFIVCFAVMCSSDIRCFIKIIIKIYMCLYTYNIHIYIYYKQLRRFCTNETKMVIDAILKKMLYIQLGKMLYEKRWL